MAHKHSEDYIAEKPAEKKSSGNKKERGKIRSVRIEFVKNGYKYSVQTGESGDMMSHKSIEYVYTDKADVLKALREDLG